MFTVLMEVKIDDVGIVLMGKVQNRTCFSALTASLDNYGFAMWRRLPLREDIFNLSLIL